MTEPKRDGQWLEAENVLGIISALETEIDDLRADLAAAITQVQRRDAIISAQSQEIERLTRLANDLVEEL